jgi:hypothetical protein
MLRKLKKLNAQVQMCFDRALDAKRKADRIADPAQKAEFRQFEKSWLALAESYELAAVLITPAHLSVSLIIITRFCKCC